MNKNDVKQKALEMIKQGHGVRETARILGNVVAPTISRWLREEGIQASRRRAHKFDRWLRESEWESLEAFIEAMRKDGYGQRHAAEIMGVSAKYLAELCDQYGIKRLGAGAEWRICRGNSGRPAKTLEWQGQKYTIAELAKMSGWETEKFRARLGTWGLERLMGHNAPERARGES